jgi:hypothetical protein
VQSDRHRQDRNYVRDLVTHHIANPLGDQTYAETALSVDTFPAHVVANPVGATFQVTLSSSPVTGARVAVTNLHSATAVTVASDALVNGAASQSIAANTSKVFVAVDDASGSPTWAMF